LSELPPAALPPWAKVMAGSIDKANRITRKRMFLRKVIQDSPSQKY
jgi:hypothetical protein